MTSYSFTPYSELLLDHFEHPRNVGESSRIDGTGRAVNPACGDELVLTLRVEADRIAEARFRATGCAASIASSSMTTVLLEGRSLDEARRLTNLEVASALGGLPPAKMHCSVLAEEAVAAALADLQARTAR
jgi:nitrogen fixation NifU-like protein